VFVPDRLSFMEFPALEHTPSRSRSADMNFNQSIAVNNWAAAAAAVSFATDNRFAALQSADGGYGGGPCTCVTSKIT